MMGKSQMPLARGQTTSSRWWVSAWVRFFLDAVQGVFCSNFAYIKISIDEEGKVGKFREALRRDIIRWPMSGISGMLLKLILIAAIARSFATQIVDLILRGQWRHVPVCRCQVWSRWKCHEKKRKHFVLSLSLSCKDCEVLSDVSRASYNANVT